MMTALIAGGVGLVLGVLAVFAFIKFYVHIQ